MSEDLKEFITKLEEKLTEYKMDKYDRGIEVATCDIQDVFKWIDETKEDMGILED